MKITQRTKLGKFHALFQKKLLLLKVGLSKIRQNKQTSGEIICSRKFSALYNTFSLILTIKKTQTAIMKFVAVML